VLQADVTDAPELDLASVLVTSRRTTKALPPVKCPKCAHRQYGKTSCDACGLIFALVKDGHRPWETYPPEQEADVARARAMWSRIEQDPGNESLHATFVSFCRERSLLLFAVTRYRHRVADDPDEPHTLAFFERVKSDAKALAQASPVVQDAFLSSVRRIRGLLLVSVLILCVIAIVVITKLVFNSGPIL